MWREVGVEGQCWSDLGLPFGMSQALMVFPFGCPLLLQLSKKDLCGSNGGPHKSQMVSWVESDLSYLTVCVLGNYCYPVLELTC